MRSTLSIEVAAPARLVFDLARDVRRWPALLPHYREVRVEGRDPDGVVTARMLAVRPIVPWLGYGLPVAWRSRTWAEERTLRLRFVHQGGASNGMDVTWRIEATPAGCTVSIDHDFNPRVPGWSALVHRLFVQPIATRTLATFKAIAEAVAPTMARVEIAEAVAPAIAVPEVASPEVASPEVASPEVAAPARRSGRSRSAKRSS